MGFISTYRWELWLLLCVPLLTMVVVSVTFILLGISCDSGWQVCDGEVFHQIYFPPS